MKFNYQARTKEGKIQTGIVEALNRQAALNVLKSHDLYPVILEKSALPFYARELTIFQRTRQKDVVVFSRQMSIMLKSDVPIVESFKTIARQTKKQNFREKLLKIAGEIDGGKSLSESLSLYPKIFSSFYINMVKSGEASGKLTDIFTYLADYLEKESSFHSKIKGAMIYPAFVSSVFLIVTLVIVVYVIPQLSMVLKESKIPLPLITRIVLASSKFLRAQGLFVIIIIVFAIVALVFFVKSRQGKKILGNWFLNLPIIGSFLKKYYLSRFALNLSTLISGGLSIVQALEITGKVVGNAKYEKIILETRDGVKRGETMSSVLGDYPKLITPLFHQMISVGEKTGNLDSSLRNVIEFYQRDVSQDLDTFVQLLEPISILILGTVVGGLMAAVLIPLYSIGGL